jgi:tetratricopeptide (TPR) repeat protein
MADIRTPAASPSTDHWWAIPTWEELCLVAIKYRRVLLGIVVAVMLIYIQGRVSEMDDRFFQSSSHGVQGLAYYMTGQYADAATAYRSHLRSGGWREWATGDPAYALLLQGNLPDASREAEARLGEQPDDIQAFLTRGEVELEQGDFRRASALFALALEKDENHFDALLLTAVAQSLADEPGRAIDTLRHALRTNSGGQRITALLWGLQLAGALRQDSLDGTQWCLLAHYYRYLRILDPSNAALAAKAAHQAISLDGRADDAYITLGVVEEKTGDYDAALPFFLKALDINPRNAEAHRWAANIYRHRGSDLLNEYRMWKGAFDAGSSDAFYRNGLIVFLSERFGDYPQALGLVTAGLAQQPQDLDLLDRAARLNQLLGNHEQAIRHYHDMLALRPNISAAYYGIGNSFTFLERFDDAIHAYQSALAINPDSAQSHSGLGGVYARKNRIQDSIREYETALQVGGDEINTRAFLCTQYWAANRYHDAEACLKHVLRHDPHNKSAMQIYPYVMKGLEYDKHAR